MKEWRPLLGFAILTALASAALVLSSCSTMQEAAVAPPGVPGATFVGNKICFECHTNITRVFPSSPHARLHFPGSDVPEMTGCESCHGAGSKHVQAGGGRGVFIVNPGKDPAACYSCHLQTHAEFRLPQHHPVLEGKMNCVQCHDPHGFDIFKPAGGLAMARLNESCASCHREQAKPFVYEHEALREGCTVCHQPHGSINPKMLVERDNNLCIKCHAQVRNPAMRPGEVVFGKRNHTQFINRGACWSAGCHSAIHGSNIHPKMLY